MFRNASVPSAIWYFVEPQRLWLMSGTDKRLIYGVFLTPSPCGTSPISFHSQGQKRLLSATILPCVRYGQENMQTWDTGLIIKKRRLRDITSGSRLVGFTIFPVAGVHIVFYSIFDNTIFVITILFLFLLFLSVYPLCNKPLHSRPTVFQHNTLFIFCRVYIILAVYI